MNPYLTRFTSEIKEAYREAYKFFRKARVDPEKYDLVQFKSAQGNETHTRISRGDNILLSDGNFILVFRTSDKLFEFRGDPTNDRVFSIGSITTYYEGGSSFETKVSHKGISLPFVALKATSSKPYKEATVRFDEDKGEVSGDFWKVYDLVNDKEGKDYLLKDVLPYVGCQ